MPRQTEFNPPLCADMEGFSLHAAVRCGAEDRQALERPCRHITRPALASDRVQCDAPRQVLLKLKTPWRDGATHLMMSPLKFMQRLAGLMPSRHLTASTLFARRPRDRLLRGDPLRAMNVADGSRAVD
jgi:hypothetical protein